MGPSWAPFWRFLDTLGRFFDASAIALFVRIEAKRSNAQHLADPDAPGIVEVLKTGPSTLRAVGPARVSALRALRRARRGVSRRVLLLAVEGAHVAT